MYRVVAALIFVLFSTFHNTSSLAAKCTTELEYANHDRYFAMIRKLNEMPDPPFGSSWMADGKHWTKEACSAMHKKKFARYKLQKFRDTIKGCVERPDMIFIGDDYTYLDGDNEICSIHGFDFRMDKTMDTIAVKIRTMIVEHLGVDKKKIKDCAKYRDELGADALDVVELRMALEEEFGLALTDAVTTSTVEYTINDIASKMIGIPDIFNNYKCK